MDKNIFYNLFYVIVTVIVIYFLYLQKDRVIVTYKINQVAKKFIKGKSDNFDKKNWELYLAKLSGIPGCSDTVDKYYPIYKKFMKKHYPGLEPEFSTLDPEYWETFLMDRKN